MDKPTILFILHLPPPVHGAAMMGQYIYDSKLINETLRCHYINLTLAKNLQDIGKGGWQKLRNFLKLLLRIRKEVKQLKPDLVYVTPNACGGAFYKDFVVVQMLKSMGCKVIAHYHNKGVATRQDHPLDNFLYRRFFKNLKVILLAEALYKDVQKYVKREDVFICSNGIPESLTEEPLGERHNKVLHLLFLSNLIISKGVLVLLDALKILKDKGYSFVCDFVGGETAELSATGFAQEVQKRGLNEIAFYQGKKFGEEKVKCFQQADIFIFPTFYPNEAFPLVNLEAMEYKLPIVTTNEGGIPDMVKDKTNGFISEKRNPESLAGCIAKLLDNEALRRQMGEAGYRMFKDQFTLQRFEARMCEMLIPCNIHRFPRLS